MVSVLGIVKIFLFGSVESGYTTLGHRVLGRKKPRGSRYPSMMILCPKTHYRHSVWDLICVCIYIYIYIQVRTYIHNAYMYTCTHAYMHPSIHPCIHTRTDMCIHLHAYTHTYVHACMHAYIHTYIHIYIYACTCIYLYLHTFPWTLWECFYKSGRPGSSQVPWWSTWGTSCSAGPTAASSPRCTECFRQLQVGG